MKIFDEVCGWPYTVAYGMVKITVPKKPRKPRKSRVAASWLPTYKKKRKVTPEKVGKIAAKRTHRPRKTPLVNNPPEDFAALFAKAAEAEE